MLQGNMPRKLWTRRNGDTKPDKKLYPVTANGMPMKFPVSAKFLVYVRFREFSAQDKRF